MYILGDGKARGFSIVFQYVLFKTLWSFVCQIIKNPHDY